MANICSNAIFCKDSKTFVQVMAFINGSKLMFENIVPEPKCVKDYLKEILDCADEIDEFYAKSYSIKDLWRKYYWGSTYNNGVETIDFGEGQQYVIFKTTWSPPYGIVKALWDKGANFDFYYNNEGYDGIYTLKMASNIQMKSQNVSDFNIIKKMAELFECPYWENNTWE